MTSAAAGGAVWAAPVVTVAPVPSVARAASDAPAGRRAASTGVARTTAATVATLLGAAGAGACELPADAGTERLEAGGVRLAWRAEPAPIAVSRGFVLQVALCPSDARLAKVDASMPEHRHGMNYRPSLVALGPGRWRADGLLWHMPGRWELRFEVEPAGGAAARQVLTQRVELR